MASITTRAGKGSQLTWNELDANFTNLNNDKLEKTGGSAALADLSLQSISATLHRSPNAITALFVYDTSKDSDGGAWTEKCQHTSWYNETLNGKWLGAQTSEANARAVSGATTDDYYQLTTDGKFYKLNATSGTTEVFRGNKRSFPKVAAIVAEAASVTIYDLTEVDRPMFARYVNTGAMATGNVAALHAVNGQVFVGGASGLSRLNFATDRLFLHTTSGMSSQAALATIRTAARTTEVGTAFTNAAIADVKATILPDAPIDPVTGLRAPTVAVATGARVVVIHSSGTLVNSSSTAAFTQVTLTPQLLSAGRADAVWYTAANPGALGAAFALTTKNANTATDFNAGYTTLLKSKDRSNYARTSGAVVQILRNNEGAIGKGLAAKLSDTYNAGWLVGDIRRAYLADIGAGSVGPTTELITNGTFDTGISPWFDLDGSTGRVVWDASGKLSVSDVSGTDGRATYNLGDASLQGKRLKITFTVSGATGRMTVGGLSPVNHSIFYAGAFGVGTHTVYLTLDAASSVGYTYGITFACVNTGTQALYDAVSVKEVTADRSYKAQGSYIYGTLTKSAVASNAQLVAYSGFSAANYLQEPYSADLDFGTGEWSASAWVNAPTANATAGILAARAYSSGPYITLGIDATNKLTATAFDGTTTRTVTTTAAYNTATWTKVRANYTTDGKLAILVNGVEVASATGTPLLTLNNSNAALTIGNSYALDAPFPGSIALLKFSATVPTSEQAVFAYEQEKQLFREGAQCVLPASTNILDLAYDDATDTWSALQASYESTWSGLGRTATATPSAGSFSKCVASSGIKLLGRTTTNPGVDVQIPAKNLRPKDMPRDTNQDIVVFDFDAVTSQTDFVLPVGYTARVVYSAGAQKREGSTKDWTRLFDGFVETIRFGTAPGNAVWVQIHAVKEVV